MRWVPSNGLYIISTVMRSILPTGGLPRCRKVGSLQQVIYYFHGHDVGFTDHDVVRWGVPRVMMGIWYGILFVSE